MTRDPDRGASLRALFELVCDLPIDQRDGVLAHHCEDPALRDEVRRLLARDARDDHPIEASLLSDPPVQPGVAIGGCRVVRRVSGGGMGTVYEAEQDLPRRRVALKILRRGLLGAEGLRRFRREADILGRLEHVAIARIYDTSTVDLGFGPQPYLVMEFIDGTTPLAHARRERLDLRARLRLLSRICSGVGYAHSRGVIHRDLKPDNILVDRAGQPRIVDFGIARELDVAENVGRSQHTVVGQLLGSLETMSPEQAGGDAHAVDTRTDVYSLGVIGYELLAERAPYDVHELPLVDALRVIREVDPPVLSRHDRALGGDVEVVIAKAMEKDPNRRYSSAAELASDLDRILRDEPIAARAPSLSYHLAKLARRHRLLLGMSGLLAAVVAASAVAVSIAWWNAKQSQRATAVALTDSEQVVRFLEDLLRSSDPERLGREVLVEDLLAQAARQVERELTDRPNVAARLLRTTGAAFRSLGQFSAAEPPLQRAVELSARARGETDVETLRSRVHLAENLLDQSRCREALPLLRDAVVACTASAAGDEVALRGYLAIGECLRQLGQCDEAVALLGDRYESLVAAGRADEPAGLECRTRLGHALLTAGQREPAREHLAAALETRRRIHGDDHPSTIEARSMLATALLELGRIEEARALYEGDLTATRRIFGPDHPRTITAMQRSAQFRRAASDFEGGLALADEMLQRSRDHRGGRHLHTLQSLVLSAQFLLALGRLDDAMLRSREGVALARDLYGDEHDQTLTARAVLAKVMADRGDLEGAEREECDILSITRERDPDGSRMLFTACFNLAATQMNRGRFDDAAMSAREAQEIGVDLLGEEHPDVLATDSLLGILWHHAGRTEDARSILARTLERQVRVLGAAHDDTIRTRFGLAQASFALGETDDALAMLQSILDTNAAKLGPSHFNTVTTSLQLANYLSQLGENERAREVLSVRRDACEVALSADHPLLAALDANLAALEGARQP